MVLDGSKIRRQRSTGRYQNARRQFLIMNPLCTECAKLGFTVAATELDHIVPVSREPERFWDTSNWQALCRMCHELKTLDENRPRTETPERRAWRQRLDEFDRKAERHAGE